VHIAGVSSATFRDRAPAQGLLNANAIIDGRSNPLLAAKVAFGRLQRTVPQEKLDLLQFSS
jgi:hypothetical protein